MGAISNTSAGEEFFQHELVHERSGLSHWRKRVGDRLDILLQETLRLDHDTGALMYILSTGCQWRALPKDLPPRSTVHDYLGLWNWDGTLDRIHHALYLKCREKAAREASSPRPASSTVRV